ncbi:MAG TPA: PLP-dependent aminotransferase family protein [Stellaceae bacterium]|jgi:GntR family transcriptional regulator/MocR family aminotransferase|nr:PLP-dependent aminotransferase family protein [Stellaceae bacterium]
MGSHALTRPPARPAGAALWTPPLDRAAPLPLSRQLAAALREAVAEGRFGTGARLPSTRELAAELGIARSTVVAVFEQLAAEGYIAARQGSGYYVPEPLAAPRAAHATPATGTPRPISRRAARLASLPPPHAHTQFRPFEAGHAEIDAPFIARWKHLAARVLAGRTRLAWGYGDPQGEPALRQAIAEYLGAARGVRCRPEQVVVTSGTQQGLSLTVQTLLDPGDTAWVEDPCYRSTVEILRAADARIVPVPVDEHGLDIAAAPSGAVSPRLVYTTPSRQYPLGMAMPLVRRAELLAWAEAAGAWLVEDDYESEFQLPSRMLPSLQGLDRAGRVIYLGTFSKLLFPSLRLGYAVLPEDLVAPFTAARHLADRQSSALLQTMMTEFILDGHFARHLKRMRALYAEREAFLLERLRTHLDGLVRTSPRESGMYLIAWLPLDWSDRAAAEALAAAGVSTAPLSAVTLATPRPPGLVLGYTGHGEAAMARAVETMARVLGFTGMKTTAKLEL